MRGRKQIAWGLIGAIGMFILIMDAKTSLKGGIDGIRICLMTVIPSLFPFFFFSGLIQAGFIGRSASFLKPIGRLCAIPEGAEYLLLLGITGGYPVGAQCINSAYVSGAISQKDANRMLSFCNNAGPAFIFGMAGALFSSPMIGWFLWGIQITSALITGMLIPGNTGNTCSITENKELKLTDIMLSALKAMATVCGWIIIFRVLLFLLERWILWLFPKKISVIIAGILELSNGCIALHQVQDPAFKFIAVSLMMILGGVCVGIQTLSVATHLNCKYYFIGKLLQLAVAMPLSALSCIFLFPGNISVTAIAAFILIPLLIIAGYKLLVKNNSGNYASNGV